MLKYTIKRLLTFIPMLIAISLLSFVITLNSPGDPLENQIQLENTAEVQETNVYNKKLKEKKIKDLGLDLPPFYLSISNYASSSALYKVYDKDERKNLERLTYNYGNWKIIEEYYSNLNILKEANNNISYDTNSVVFESLSQSLSKSKKEIVSDIKNDQINIRNAISKLLIKSGEKDRNAKIKELKSIILGENAIAFEPLQKKLDNLISSEKNLEQKQTRWKNYIPVIKFFGSKNQYHQWLFGNGKNRKGILRGDFGNSLKLDQPISDILWDRIGISFFLSIVSMFFAYLISLPLGIYAAYNKDSLADRGTSLILFILYSMPSFFVGVVLLLLFANSKEYWHLFPESGIANPVTYDPNWKWYEWQSIKHMAPYLVLPLITYTYGSFAFLSRIMRIGMIEILNQDYIRTARAKGLSEKVVILKHALRNSLLPIITVFAAIFPMAIGGSIVIEYIFSIPGMGMEIFNAIEGRDYPVVIAFFTIAGFLTMLGYLVSDILYAVVDPRISFK
tara:strand:- start:5179 stop:6699 length:1521 start_codon:yes stop_codon:yes gene_type:complete